MKRVFSKIFFASLALGWVSLQSCTSEAPFDSADQGTIRLNTELRSDVDLVTRALDTQTKKELEDNLTIYIENDKGVIRRYIGKKELPGSLTLNAGEYAIEGWTGDSVSASYTKKFYRGYQKFTVEPGAVSEVNFDVNIANVIVSVDAETLEQDFDEFKVTFSHSKGELEFDRNSTLEGKKGYFMMPSTDSDLHYKVELKNELGEDIVIENDIRNVLRAHEYSIKILTERPENSYGGGEFKIEILEIPVIDKKLNVYPAPIYYAQVGEDTEEFDIANNQIDFSTKEYKDVRFRVVGYGGLSKLTLNFPSPFKDMDIINGVNIVNNASNALALQSLSAKGVEYKAEKLGYVFDDSGSTPVQECWLIFSKDFFSSLDDSEQEYVINVSATDSKEIPTSSSIAIRFANNEKAVDKRIVESMPAVDTDDEASPMAILARTAEIGIKVNTDDASEYGIEYRKKSSSDSFVPVPVSGISQGNIGKVILTGLEPGTEYEYRAYSAGYVEQNLKSFRTEGAFTIPNASMESWITINSTTTAAKDVPVPSEGTSVEYWDTGNHGSRSVSLMAVTLTEGSTTIKHNGNKSARLLSKFVGAGALGKFGTGNIFTGYFAERDGMDGVLQLGRPYNNSHPSSLNVYVHYRPGTVANNVADGTHLNSGDKDVAQIYVALTTETFEVRTKNQSKLFDPSDPTVLAYGQITLSGDIGEGSEMALQNIKLKYKEAAKTQKTQYLVIVCAASKFGDFFVGGENSTMYVDDFELQYDEVEFGVDSDFN